MCVRAAAGGVGGAALVQHARLIRGHHVFDVDEGVFAAVPFEGFQGLLYQVANVLAFLLRVIDPISGVA